MSSSAIISPPPPPQSNSTLLLHSILLLSNSSSFLSPIITFDVDLDSTDDRNASRNIADDRGFRILLIIEMIVGLIAFVLNVILLWIIPRVGVFHANLRTILAYMSLNLLLYSAACCVKESIMLYRIYETPIDIDQDHSDRLSTKAFECKLQELTNTIPVGNIVYASLVLVTERMYSTIRYRRYDQDHNGPWLAVVLLVTAAVPVLWSQLSGLFDISRAKMIPVCESLISMNAKGAAQVLALNMSAEILTIAMALFLYFWNNYKLKKAAVNRAKHTLSSRFQISQNVQMNSLLLPSMLFQSFCYLPNYLFLLIIIVGVPFSVETKTWLLHVNYLWKEAYAIAHPLLALKRNAHIMEQLKRRTPRTLLRLFGADRTAEGKVTPIVMVTAASGRRHVTSSDMYFEVLDKIWDQQKMPLPPQTKQSINAGARTTIEIQLGSNGAWETPLASEVRVGWCSRVD